MRVRRRDGVPGGAERRARRPGRRRTRPARAAAAPGSRARRSGATYLDTVMPRPQRRKRADREQHGERDREQHDRDGRGAGGVVALDLAEDVDGRDLGLERAGCPEMSTTAPNSPTARANASATPERIAGSRFGKMIRRKIGERRAPSEAAASSISRSSSSSTGCTARTTKGSVTNSSASITTEPR